MFTDPRLKRLKIRSWRRGTKEMDLILGPFCDQQITTLNANELDLYEALLEENDHDLYLWVSGKFAPPEQYGVLLARIGAHAGVI